MFKEIIIFNLLYKWKYLFAIFKSKLNNRNPSDKCNTITYVAREVDKTWIFGAKVKRLSKFSGLTSTAYYHNKLRNLPKSDGYFFIFPQYFCRALRHNPFILNKRTIVMFTHINWTSSFSKTHIIWCLNKADKIICLNSDVKKQLINDGLIAHKIEVIHIASDPDFFYPHERTTGSIGFCSAYGERKNPEMVYQLIKNLPDRNFYLIGKNWEEFEKFEELSKLKNLTYFNNEDYKKYPDLYNKIDIFISPSTLEGGPVPLLEAMLANCFPIATKTGFCPDIIEHGKNGYLFEIDANYKTVIELINKADTHSNNVRDTVLDHSWQNCSLKIDNLFKKI